MKKIFVLCGIIAIAGAILLARALNQPKIYGAFTGAPRVEIAEVIAHPEAYLLKTVELQGEITDQCETMGCYFYFRFGNQKLRVDLSQIAMAAPKHRNGTIAKVEGRTVPFERGTYQFWASAVEFQ